MNKCKHCKKEVTGSTHYCHSTNQTYDEDDGASFLLSAAIGYATDSTLLGALVGGDIVGAAAGDFLNGDSIFD